MTVRHEEMDFKTIPKTGSCFSKKIISPEASNADKVGMVLVCRITTSISSRSNFGISGHGVKWCTSKTGFP
jgi:hypothetical protein